MKPPIVIGLDASWRNTGIAILDDDKILHLELIRTYKGKKSHIDDIQKNGEKIRATLVSLFAQYSPGLIAYEQADFNRSFRQDLYRTGEQANLKREGQARESLARVEMIIAKICWDYDYHLVSLGANHVKNSFGAKSKEGVASLVAAQFSDQITVINEVLYFGEKQVSDHESDAISIAFVAAKEDRQQELAQVQ